MILLNMVIQPVLAYACLPDVFTTQLIFVKNAGKNPTKSCWVEIQIQLNTEFWVILLKKLKGKQHKLNDKLLSSTFVFYNRTKPSVKEWRTFPLSFCTTKPANTAKIITKIIDNNNNSNNNYYRNIINNWKLVHKYIGSNNK